MKLYVCVEFSTKTDTVMLNFYQWCKTPSSVFSKKTSATTPNFLHVFGRAPSDLQLCFVQLKTLAPSARYSTFKYPWNPGYGSLKIIENYKTKSGTHDFLLLLLLLLLLKSYTSTKRQNKTEERTEQSTCTQIACNEWHVACSESVRQMSQAISNHYTLLQ